MKQRSKQFFKLVKVMSLFILILAGHQSLGKPKKKPKYPAVEIVSGKVFQVVDHLEVEKRAAKLEQKENSVRIGQIFKDKVFIKTSQAAEIKIKLNSKDSIYILEESEIEIPIIGWERGETPQIRIKSGRFQYICSEECERKVLSPLYEEVLGAGIYEIGYEPTVPQIHLKVFQGSIQFRAIENENSIKVDAGQQCTFKGMLENDEPAFDVLLQGRRIAKGQYTAVQPISEVDLKFWSEKEVIAKKKALKIARAKEEENRSSNICRQPKAEFGQCVWDCEKNKKGSKICSVGQGAVCVRRRCDANGNWSDRTEISTAASPCQVKSVVGPCDY